MSTTSSIEGQWQGRVFRWRPLEGGWTWSVGLHGRVAVYTYEASGRPWTFILDGVIYRRSLNGTMLAKWRPPGRPRQRRRLSRAETLALEAQARARVAAFLAAWEAGEVTFRQPPPADMRERMAAALAFDEAAARADAARFAQVYRPIGILPPDQYLAVVVQITEGCSFNTCTFCTFYRDQPFRIKSPDEVQAHARAVRAFLGPGLPMRRGIFLGAANALITPMPRLLAAFAAVRAVFPEPRFGELFAFLDAFSGERKTAADYAALAARGLRRVYIGLESGHAPLLRFLRKPGTPDDALRAVLAMKAGGLSVGIILLLGAGGDRFAEGHVRDTRDLLAALPLEREDIVYFSELVVTPHMPYAREAVRAGLRALTPREQAEQQRAMLAGVPWAHRKPGPRISRYDIREFVY